MKTIDKSTVKEFNLQRYLGKWYEIARYDHRFERGLHYVTAEYSKRPDGKIKVLNCGHQDAVDGKEKCSIGKARLPITVSPVNCRSLSSCRFTAITTFSSWTRTTNGR